MKLCSKCKVLPMVANKAYCAPCRNTYNRDYRNRAGRQSQRWYALKFKYGITRDEYEQMCEDQDNRCAICDTRCKLVVDHVKGTKIIRGLLCANCNAGIGLLNHDESNLVKAIAYLK